MPSIGPLEIAVVLVIILLLFGPKRLPELGRSMGRGIKEFRHSLGRGHNDEDDPDPGFRQTHGDRLEKDSQRRP
jgi:sec-independent protein translocase protein TatA